MICPHGHDEGMVERRATPDEVDAGCELGIAFDPCPKCAFVSRYSPLPCCDYRDHSPGPCACPKHQQSALHPFSESDTLLGVPDYDHQAETGQGPPG